MCVVAATANQQMRRIHPKYAAPAGGTELALRHQKSNLAPGSGSSKKNNNSASSATTTQVCHAEPATETGAEMDTKTTNFATDATASV